MSSIDDQATSCKLERTRRGWRVVVEQPDGDPAVVEVRGAHVRHGAVRAAVTVRRADASVTAELVTLTAAKARARFIEALAAKGVDVPEAALIALDEACQTQPADEEPEAASEDEPPGTSRPLAELLDAIVVLLERYVIFATPAQPFAVALWVAHTHVLAAFDVTPYLHVSSAEKRSAKTRLLELLDELVPRAWRVVGASAAVIFRRIERRQPVLLLDEVDAIFKGKPSETAEALRGVLNAGYRRGASVPRCVGKNFEEEKDFSTRRLPRWGRPPTSPSTSRNSASARSRSGSGR